MNPDDISSSRRGLLKTGITAAGAVFVAQETIHGQSRTGPAAITGRRFRAWVSRGAGPGRTKLEELTLRPITGRQVVVRTEATNLCYSNAGAVLGIQANAAAAGPFGSLNDLALIQGHGGVGVV